MQFRAHSRVCFQSKKEEDAEEMVYQKTWNVGRMSFILGYLPEWLRICIAHKDDGTEEILPIAMQSQTLFAAGMILMPNGSRTDALAQGAAQIESKVPSLYIGDEASLQDEWATSQAAVIPCISNGGRALTVGTMRLPSDYGEEVATAADVDPDSEMRGIARFKSKSGVSCLRIHYSADPDKDPKTEKGLAWFVEESSRMPGGFKGVNWQQHMEINPQSVTGTKCIDYWDEIKSRVIIDDIPYEQAALWRIGCGADYGTRNPTVLIYFAIDYHGNAYAIDEVAAPGGQVHHMPGVTKGGIAGLAQLFKQHPLWHRVNGQIQMDSTTEAENQNTEGGLTSVMQMFGQHGVFMQPAKARGDTADDLTLNWLHERWAGYEEPDWQPQFFICRRCTGLIRILERAEYADWSPTAQSVNELKKKMRPMIGMDFFDSLKHWVVSLPQGPARVKAAPPMGSFPWLRALVLRETRRHASVRQ
jgi:hypothetical protein